MKNKQTIIFKLLFLIFLSSNSHFVLAQYVDLQKNKNISWIAEFSNDYSFSLNASEKEEQIKLTKFNGDASNFSNANHSNWLVNWIFNYAKEGQYNVYKDANFTQPISTTEMKELITYRDTVVTFNADTYMEMVNYIEAQYSPKDLGGLRVKQVIFYDKKRNVFDTRVISVAPLLVRTIRATQKSKKEKKIITPLFWIKMDGKLPKKFKSNSSAINWSALVFSKKNPVDLNSINNVKTETGFDVKKRLYEQAVNFEKPILRTFNDRDKLNAEDLNSIYTTVDTVVTYSTATYEQVTKLIEKELQSDDIFKLRLVQEWYFDKERKTLMNRLKAICPMIDAKAGERAYTVLRPLYFIKYD